MPYGRREQRCETCRYHCHEDIDDGWVCVNADSAHCTDWTEDDCGCDQWEAED